jgi:hypothetical protein
LDDELMHALGVADRDVERDGGAIRIAPDVGLLDAQFVERLDHVVGEQVVVQGPVDIGRAAVALEVEADDPPIFGQRRDQHAERVVDRREGTMQQHQRHPALAVAFVVHVEAVDVDVSGGRGSGHLCLRWLGFGKSDGRCGKRGCGGGDESSPAHLLFLPVRGAGICPRSDNTTNRTSGTRQRATDFLEFSSPAGSSRPYPATWLRRVRRLTEGGVER